MMDTHEGGIQRLALAIDQDGRWLLTALLLDDAALRLRVLQSALDDMDEVVVEFAPPEGRRVFHRVAGPCLLELQDARADSLIAEDLPPEVVPTLPRLLVVWRLVSVHGHLDVLGGDHAAIRQFWAGLLDDPSARWETTTVGPRPRRRGRRPVARPIAK